MNHQTYEVFYYKRHNGENNHMGYYGANLYNLTGNQRDEMLINMWDIVPGTGIRWFNWIYEPNFTIDVEEECDNIPDAYQLYPNYPNPFNPATTIKFDIARSSIANLKIYNTLGKEIKTLIEKELSPGSYTISWEARDSKGQLLPSGIYLIRLSATDGANDYSKTIKTILMK